MSKHPEILWAQRSSTSAPEKNIIYLTINLPDIAENTLQYELTPTSISFKASAGSPLGEYAFDLPFFEQVDPEKSTRRLTSRSLFVVLRKKESRSEYWPRLTKDKAKTPFVKTDFSRWADEDEQETSAIDPDDDIGGPGMGLDGGLGGMDFSQACFPPFMDPSKTSDLHVSGGSDLGANDADESDDEDGPPPLEEPENPK